MSDDAPRIILKEGRLSASGTLLQREIGRILTKAYPGWHWAIRVDEWGGLVEIRCMNLSTKLGYRLKIKDLQDPVRIRKDVVRAGGEILERYRLQRKARTPGATLGLPRLFNREPLGDFS